MGQNPRLSVDTSGYVSSDYVTISVKPGRAISIEAEMAALEAARQAAEEAEQASRAAEEAQIAAAKSQAEANAAKGSSQTSGKSGKILEALRKRARLHQPLNHPT